MYCSNCATKIEESFSYCRNCGLEIQELSSSGKKPRFSSKVIQFILGSAAYVVFFFCLFLFLSIFLPRFGNPQLSMLILLFGGAIISGVCLIMLKETRNRSEKPGIRDRERQNEIGGSRLFGLPESQFSGARDSVVNATTRELKVRSIRKRKP